MLPPQFAVTLIRTASSLAYALKNPSADEDLMNKLEDIDWDTLFRHLAPRIGMCLVGDLFAIETQARQILMREQNVMVNRLREGRPSDEDHEALMVSLDHFIKEICAMKRNQAMVRDSLKTIRKILDTQQSHAKDTTQPAGARHD